VTPARRLTFYAGIVDGYYLIADLPTEAYARVAELNRRFDDLDLGFVDAAVIALAEMLGLSRVATTDRRHFAPSRVSAFPAAVAVSATDADDPRTRAEGLVKLQRAISDKAEVVLRP
jgi:hypothetical protein